VDFVGDVLKVQIHHLKVRTWLCGRSLEPRDESRLDRHSEPDRIIRSMHEILLRAEVSLGRLDGSVPKEHLDLLKLAAGRAAQLRASATQIMRRNPGYAGFRRVLP
jgi:hypothetical protein